MEHCVTEIMLLTHLGLESEGDGQMAVHPLLLLDIFIDRIAICIENNTAIAVRCDFFVGLL